MATTIRIKDKTFVLPDNESPCELWRGYFEKLKKEVGTDNARTLWLITWQANGSDSCTTNGAFNKWLVKNHLDVSSAATRAVADVSAMGSNILGFGKGLTKTLSIAIPLTLAGVVAAILFILYNTARNSDATDAAMLLTPTGKLKGILR